MPLESKPPYEFSHKINETELLKLRDLCLSSVKDEELYYLRNDAKIRAVYSTQTYDEFKDIVDAAHLKPLSKFDKSNVACKNRLWNTASKEIQY